MTSDPLWPRETKPRSRRQTGSWRGSSHQSSAALPPVLFELPDLTANEKFARIDYPQDLSSGRLDPGFEDPSPSEQPLPTDEPTFEPTSESIPDPVLAPSTSHQSDSSPSWFGAKGLVIFLACAVTLTIVMIQRDRTQTTDSQDSERQTGTDTAEDLILPDVQIADNGDLEQDLAAPSLELSGANDTENNPASSTSRDTFPGLNGPSEELGSVPEILADVTSNAPKSSESTDSTPNTQQPVDPAQLFSEAQFSLNSDPQSLADLQPPSDTSPPALTSTEEVPGAGDSVMSISTLPPDHLNSGANTTNDLPALPSTANPGPAMIQQPAKTVQPPSEVAQPQLTVQPISAAINRTPSQSPFEFSQTPFGISDWGQYLTRPITQSTVPTP